MPSVLHGAVPTPAPISTSLKRPLQDSPLPTAKRQKVSSSSTQPHVSPHFTKTTPAQKSAFDLEVAKFFYACNLPFNLADHPQWTKVCSLLRPGYTPPSRKDIAGSLLDKVYEELRGDMKEAVSGKTATLVEDGWSNIHNEPVIASCLQVENSVYFLDSHDTGSMTKSAENCKVLCLESIQKAKDEFNCDVKGVVTDNARSMEKMRKDLLEQDSDLIVYGCSAHWLQLLGRDCTPSAITKHITVVQKYFRNHHKPQAWLSEKGGKKPVLAGDTRWNSEIDMVESFLANRCYYQQIIQEHEKDLSFDSLLVAKVMDYSLCKNGKDLVDQLRPIASALDRCQSDGSSLADACDAWLGLLSEPALRPHEKVVNKRFQDAITLEHLTAYMLHPKYRGEKLTMEQQQDVSTWLANRDPGFITSFISFQAKVAPFPSFSRSDQHLPTHLVARCCSLWC